MILYYGAHYADPVSQILYQIHYLPEQGITRMHTKAHRDTNMIFQRYAIYDRKRECVRVTVSQTTYQ